MRVREDKHWTVPALAALELPVSDELHDPVEPAAQLAVAEIEAAVDDVPVKDRSARGERTVELHGRAPLAFGSHVKEHPWGQSRKLIALDLPGVERGVRPCWMRKRPHRQGAGIHPLPEAPHLRR
jgi:uncharacterized protein YceK